MLRLATSPDFRLLSNLLRFGAHREAQASARALRDDLINIERPWTYHRDRGYQPVLSVSHCIGKRVNTTGWFAADEKKDRR
jgi:hypothetical protein